MEASKHCFLFLCSEKIQHRSTK